MSFAFWHVACEGCMVWRQTERPRFWRMLLYLLIKEALDHCRHHCGAPQSPQTWPRGMVLPVDPSSFSIWYLLNWSAQKGRKDWWKTTRTASLEDFMLAGVTELHCGGRELCHPGLVQSCHKGQCPMVTSEKSELIGVIEKSWTWATLGLNRWTGEWQ